MKIDQIYNLESFKAFCDSGSKAEFQDSYAGTVLARNLTAVDPKLFEKKYPELAMVNSGVQADNSGGYAQKIQSLRLVELGGFSQAGDQSSNKGKISLTAEDSYLTVVEREAESDWTETKVKQAELQNVNLPSQYIAAHNKIYLREIDEYGLLGMGTQKGLLNYTGFTSSAAAGAITTLNAAQMYSAFADLITDQWNAVNNTPEYMAGGVMTTVEAMNLLTTTILNSAGSEMSVFRALTANFPGVKFGSSFRADDADGSGTSATVAYSNNEEVMKMRIPEPLKIGEIIKVGSFDYKVDSKYRIAGLDVLEDSGARILTGL